MPSWKRRKEERCIPLRDVVDAVLFAVTTDTAWGQIPTAFGVPPDTARRRFEAWTEVELWRRLAVAALYTKHCDWARQLAAAAFDYARGYPQPEPDFGLPATPAHDPVAERSVK